MADASVASSAGWRRRALLGCGVAGVAVLIWGALRLAGLEEVLSMVIASLLSGVTAALVSQPVSPAAPVTPVVPEAGPVLPVETLRTLRHDLRGILSPALMTADRLLMTTEDPIAKRAAETMVETIERVEKRLAG